MSHTILVIEDERPIAQVIQHMLEYEGRYMVLTAEDGAEGLDLIAKQAFDAVLSDIKLPQVDGIAVCRALKGDPSYAHIPIVLMSVAGPPSPGSCSYNAFVAKPIDLDSLLSTLRKVLAPQLGGAA